MGIMHDTMVLVVCIFLNCWFPAMDRIIWYADYIFPLTSCIWVFIFACVFKLHLVQREGWHIIEGPSFRIFPFRFLDVVSVCYFIVYVGFRLIFRCLPGLFPSSAYWFICWLHPSALCTVVLTGLLFVDAIADVEFLSESVFRWWLGFNVLVKVSRNLSEYVFWNIFVNNIHDTVQPCHVIVFSYAQEGSI